MVASSPNIKVRKLLSSPPSGPLDPYHDKNQHRPYLQWVNSWHRGAGRVFQKLVRFTTPMRPIPKIKIDFPFDSQVYNPIS